MKTNVNTGLKRAYRENDADPAMQKIAANVDEAAARERRKQQQIADAAIKKVMKK